MTKSKRLFLLRHAQALSDAPHDKERALSPKGVEDARALGKYMLERGFAVDFTLCSPALRTRQTLEGLGHHIGVGTAEHPDSLYNGAAGDYLAQIQGTSDEYSSILMVAHNPSIYELVIRLSDPAQDDFIARLSEGYAPASLSVLECACTKWADIQMGENALTFLTNPLDYNAPARPTRWM